MSSRKHHAHVTTLFILITLFLDGFCQTQLDQSESESTGPVFMDPLRRALGLWGRLLNRMSQNGPPTDDQLHLKGAASELEQAFARHSGHKMVGAAESNNNVDGGGGGGGGGGGEGGDIEWEDSPKKSPSGGFGGGFGSAKSPTGGFGGGSGATQFSAGGSPADIGPSVSVSSHIATGADRIINQEKLYELLPRINPKMTSSTSTTAATTTTPPTTSTTTAPTTTATTTTASTSTTTPATTTSTTEPSTTIMVIMQNASTRSKRRKSEKRKKRKKQKFLEASTSAKMTILPDATSKMAPVTPSTLETIMTTVEEPNKLIDKTTKILPMPDAILKVRMSTLADDKAGFETKKKHPDTNETAIIQKLENETAELIAEIESALKSGESTESGKYWKTPVADDRKSKLTTTKTTTTPSTTTTTAAATTTPENNKIHEQETTTVEGSGEHSEEDAAEEESREGNSVGESDEEEYEGEDEEDITQTTSQTTKTSTTSTTPKASTKSSARKMKSKNGTLNIPEAEEEEQLANFAQLQLDATPTPGVDLSLTTTPPNAHTIFNVNSNANSNTNPNLSNVITPVNTIIDGIGPLILPLIGYSRKALDAYATQLQPGVIGGGIGRRLDGVSIYRPDSSQFQPIAVQQPIPVPPNFLGGQALIQNAQPQPLPPVVDTRYKPRQHVLPPTERPGDLKSAPLGSKTDYYPIQVVPPQVASAQKPSFGTDIVVPMTKITRREELHSSAEDRRHLMHSPTAERTVFAPRRPGVSAAEVSGPHVRFLPDPPAAKSAATEDAPTLEELGRILERTKQQQQRMSAPVKENFGFVQEVSGSEPSTIEKPYFPPQLERIFQQKTSMESMPVRRPEPEIGERSAEQKVDNTAQTGSPKVGRQRVQNTFFEDSGIMVKETAAPPLPVDPSQEQSSGFGGGNGFGGGKRPSFIW